MLRSLLPVIAGLVLVVAGCASADDGAPEPGGSGGGAGFPVTIDHRFGQTVIPATPRRVVTIGFNEHDFALAFGVLPGATTWEDQTRITGTALGQEGRADELVAQTRQRFDDAIRAHPEFAGKSARFLLGLSRTGELRISLGADDYRSRWLTELGFQVPARSEQISFELIDGLEADVLVAEGVDPDSFASPLVQQMPAVREGRFLNMGGFDQDFAGALGFNSPLSIPFLLETAVPRLAAALDGDPSTKPEPFGG